MAGRDNARSLAQPKGNRDAFVLAGGIGVLAVLSTLYSLSRVLLQLGAGAKKAPFLLCDQRYVPVLSGRLEYPANNHCIRIRVTIGKHRALPLPQ